MLGGAEGIRTPDLLSAIQARSQLRHSPTRIAAPKVITAATDGQADIGFVVFPLRLRNLEIVFGFSASSKRSM